MSYTESEIAQLLLKQMAGPLTSKEAAILQEWQQQPENELFIRQMLKPGILRAHMQAFEAAKQQAAHAKTPVITPVAPAPSARGVIFLRKWGWAASVILVLGIGSYFLTRNKEDKHLSVAEQALMNIAPGKAGAVLTLADGSQVVLDSVKDSVLALQNGVTAKVINGTLLYEGKGSEVVYNTMSTPKGRQYQVTLPDGTKVWLNAASRIRFPTSFGKDRTVEIIGECYLEVVADSKKPFFVKTTSTVIQVLGTSFNVKAYADEPIKTSLLEGSVKIDNTILKPGEAYQRGKLIATNIEQDISWKNGVFDFEDQGLQEVMQQLARWYNLEIRYEGNIPDIQFGGKMGRDVNLSSILNFLKKWGVRFQIKDDGKELIVSG